jgi:hypothetical protein
MRAANIGELHRGLLQSRSNRLESGFEPSRSKCFAYSKFLDPYQEKDGKNDFCETPETPHALRKMAWH